MIIGHTTPMYENTIGVSGNVGVSAEMFPTHCTEIVGLHKHRLLHCQYLLLPQLNIFTLLKTFSDTGHPVIVDCLPGECLEGWQDDGDVPMFR